jgi:hypothetical protein
MLEKSFLWQLVVHQLVQLFLHKISQTYMLPFVLVDSNQGWNWVVMFSLYMHPFIGCFQILSSDSSLVPAGCDQWSVMITMTN